MAIPSEFPLDLLEESHRRRIAAHTVTERAARPELRALATEGEVSARLSEEDACDRARAEFYRPPQRQDQGSHLQHLLAQAFLQAPMPVCILNRQGHVTLSNPACERLLGAEPGTLLAAHALDLIAPRYHAAIAAARKQQEIDGLEYELDVALLHSDGSEIAARITNSLIHTPALDRFQVCSIAPAALPDSPQRPLTVTAAGRIQLIGLEEVQRQLGAQWFALKDRVTASAERVIRRRLGQLDTVHRTSDGGFVVCFAEATEEEASIRAAAIAMEVQRRLVGEGTSSDVAHVFSAATSLPAEADELRADEPAALAHRQIERHRPVLQEVARIRLAQALHNVAYDAEIVRSRESATPIGLLLRLPRTTMRAIDAALGIFPTAETGGLHQDLLLLSCARECAINAAIHNEGLLVFVTLSSDLLLSSTHLNACVQAVRAIEERLRRQLAVILTVPPECSSRQLKNAMLRLRSLCGLLGVAVDSLDDATWNFYELGISIVVLDVSVAGAMRPWATNAKMRIESLHAQRCRVMVSGARRTDASALFRQGADLISMAKD